MKTKLLFLLLLNVVQLFSQKQLTDLLHSEMEALSSANIIWLGELHGTTTNYDVAIEMLSTLDKNISIDHLLIEGGYISELQLNEYLKTGEDALLDLIMKSVKNTFSYTYEFKNYLKQLYELNRSRAEENKLKVISIDIEHQFWVTHQFIIDEFFTQLQVPSSLVLSKITRPKYDAELEKFYIELLTDMKKQEASYKEIYAERFDELFYMVRNITYRSETKGRKNFNEIRDSLIYENFKLRSQTIDWTNQKAFAFWGREHIYQAENKETKWIATYIKEKHPDIKQIGFSCLYSKCEFNVPSFLVPKFLRKRIKGNYVTTKMMNSDNLFAKIRGTKYVKRKAKNDISVFKTSELPERKNFIFRRNKKIPNQAYVQYLILIKNSKACQPISS